VMVLWALAVLGCGVLSCWFRLGFFRLRVVLVFGVLFGRMMSVFRRKRL